MKKELWIPLVIFGLSAAFGLVCLLVRLSRGHPALVRHKLHLGALLLTLAGMASGLGCGLKDGSDPWSGGQSSNCYVPPYDGGEIGWLQVEVQGRPAGEQIAVSLPAGRHLTGEVHYSQTGAYSFRVVDADRTELQRGPLVPDDGAFDRPDEVFGFDLDAALPAGEHSLLIYAQALEELGEDPQHQAAAFGLLLSRSGDLH